MPDMISMDDYCRDMDELGGRAAIVIGHVRRERDSMINVLRAILAELGEVRFYAGTMRPVGELPDIELSYFPETNEYRLRLAKGKV